MRSYIRSRATYIDNYLRDESVWNACIKLDAEIQRATNSKMSFPFVAMVFRFQDGRAVRKPIDETDTKARVLSFTKDRLTSF